MAEFFNNIGTYLQEYGLRIAFAACVVIVGALLTVLLSFVLKKILYKTKLDDAGVSFIVALFKIVMAVIIILFCASALDLSTSSLIVSLSTVALAVALALKDSLANLANGILIIANKPFRRGDYVSINGIDGRVQNIRLLTVELITFNNTKIILANTKVVGGDVLNYSAMPIRRVDMNFSVAYGSDMDKVESILKTLAAENEKILSSVPPVIFMQSHDSSSIQYVFNVWVNTVDFFNVKNSMPRKVYDAFEKAGVCIPFNQLDVHIKDNAIGRV